jgi:hypothetical protein
MRKRRPSVSFTQSKQGAPSLDDILIVLQDTKFNLGINFIVSIYDSCSYLQGILELTRIAWKNWIQLLLFQMEMNTRWWLQRFESLDRDSCMFYASFSYSVGASATFGTANRIFHFSHCTVQGSWIKEIFWYFHAQLLLYFKKTSYYLQRQILSGYYYIFLEETSFLTCSWTPQFSLLWVYSRRNCNYFGYPNR